MKSLIQTLFQTKSKLYYLVLLKNNIFYDRGNINQPSRAIRIRQYTLLIIYICGYINSDLIASVMILLLHVKNKNLNEKSSRDDVAVQPLYSTAPLAPLCLFREILQNFYIHVDRHLSFAIYIEAVFSAFHLCLAQFQTNQLTLVKLEE